MRRLLIVLALLTLLVIAAPSNAQVTAISCSSTDVQNAINSATAGQTVNVPAGNCSWGLNAVTLNKAITLNAAPNTNITFTAHPTFPITKQNSGTTYIQGFHFITATGGGTLPHPITINGPWPTTSTGAVVFRNNTFSVNNDTVFDDFTVGGVILSHNTFTGTWNDFFITNKALSFSNSWTTADTMGTRDTTGTNNLYVEDNTFIGGSNGLIDCDDNCRVVWRHNQHGSGGQDAGGFNSHGFDSSPQGMRHFEIYSNNFIFPDKTNPLGNSSLSNINQYIWIRGGTGVIFNNSSDALTSQTWGDKPEWRFNIRGIQDDRPQGACSNVSYPVPNQIGQNNNGTSNFTDPVWIWGNTSNTGTDSGGFQIALSAGFVTWVSGQPINPCFSVYQSLGYGNTDAEQWSHFFQFPRDVTNTTLGTNLCTNTSEGCTVEGIGGTPKPGYTPFTYPHPLVASQPPNPPSPPTNLIGSVAGSTVSLSWTASAGSPTPTGYTLYRGTVHGGPYTAIKSGLTTTSTTDTPANGTYFYTVAGFVGGLVSGVSGNGTTATVTCTTTCTFASGTAFTIAGDSQAAFNGTFSSTGQPTSNTFTFASATSASGTGGGAWPTSNESVKSNEVQATVPAALTVSLLPATRTFASQTVGTTSASQSVTLTNTSGAGSTVTISAKAITGANAGDYAQNNNCPSLLLSGTNCTFNITFSPTAAGTRVATLSVTDNASGSPQTVALSGTGVAQTPGVSLNPTSLNFGDQTLSTTSTVRSIILTNTGSGVLTITSVVASGDFAVVTVPVTNCGGTLASLATCSLNVTFTPTATGGRTGAVTVTDNAAGSPHVATLSGNGITTKCTFTGTVTLSGVGSVCQ